VRLRGFRTGLDERWLPESARIRQSRKPTQLYCLCRFVEATRPIIKRHLDNQLLRNGQVQPASDGQGVLRDRILPPFQLGEDLLAVQSVLSGITLLLGKLAVQAIHAIRRRQGQPPEGYAGRIVDLALPFRRVDDVRLAAPGLASINQWRLLNPCLCGKPGDEVREYPCSEDALDAPHFGPGPGPIGSDGQREYQKLAPRHLVDFRTLKAKLDLERHFPDLLW
jgi:hypothetical protein